MSRRGTPRGRPKSALPTKEGWHKTRPYVVREKIAKMTSI
jgi:hypothetical protein